MYRNLMIKGYADLFNVNVLCTDACVWLHTLIYMIKRNPQKCRIPLCTKKIMHSLTHEDYWNVHWKKPIQIFKIHVYKHVSFSGFFFVCFEIEWIKNISGMYEATSTFYFTQYIIFGFLSVYFTLSRVKELLNAIKWD